MFAIIDAEDYEEINKYTWQARKSFCRYYAQRKVKTKTGEFWIKMHRQIMNTPSGYIVHHKNHRTMDNRKCNLANMTQKDHRHEHTSSFPGRCPVKKSG